MEKSLSMIINDTKTKLIQACNESTLPVNILELIVKDIYTEIHLLAEKQLQEDTKKYDIQMKQMKSKKPVVEA